LNKRVVFVVGLAVVGSVGLVLLLAAVPLSQFLGFNTNDDGDNTFGAAVIVISFIAFGISDICYDCLLIPGRSLLDDLAVPLGRAEDANALFTGFQLGGRLLALLIVSSSMTSTGFWVILNGEDAHFDAVMSTNVLYLVVTTTVVLLAVTDVGSIPADDAVIGEDPDRNVIVTENEEFIGSYSGNVNYNAEYSPQDDSIPSHPDFSKTRYQSMSILLNEQEQSDGPSTFQKITSICGYKPDATVLLCAVQAAGWTAITSQSFLWTSWRGEQIGSIDLALQGVVGIITSALLPIANNRIGAATVWLASELFFHLLMISVAFADIESNIPRMISALCGINYAIHATNGLIVAADVVADSSKRARTIAMVNNALPMGQLVTALFGGMIAQYFDGFQNVFVCFGAVGCIVTGFVWIVSSRQGLFVKG
jgi:hypothetical protein